MIRSKSLLVSSTVFFLITETLLGIRFQTGGHGAVLRFVSVVVACLFCVLFAERSLVYILTQLALILTVCADWFLVLPPSPNQLPGMLFFSAVQLIYAYRLSLSEEKPVHGRRHLLTRAILSVGTILIAVWVLGENVDAVALLSVFYYTNLILNLLYSAAGFRHHGVMAVGFLLFLCCDTLVGLAFLDGYFTVPEDSFIHWITHPGFDLAWAFYLPSQMLLAASLLPVRLRQDRETNLARP